MSFFFSDDSIGIFDVDVDSAQQSAYLIEGICLIRHCRLLDLFTLDESSFDRWFRESSELCKRISRGD